jgi:hypothetical protein
MRGLILCVLAAAMVTCAVAQPKTDWNAIPEKQARETMLAMRTKGQVGGSWDLRVTGTDRSYNYKLRATWITPEVATAAARVLMLTKGISGEQAEEVAGAVATADAWFVFVELDPREGSGVIPREWISRFGLRENESRQAVGQALPAEGVWKSLMSAFPRDYSYDTFLLKFPKSAPGGVSLLEPGEAELRVRIYNKQGRALWKVPASLLH